MDYKSVQEYIKIFNETQNTFYYNISKYLQKMIGKHIEIIKNNHCTYIVVIILNFKVVIKYENNNIKIGLIEKHSYNYINSIFKKDLVLKINDIISLVYNCNICDKEEDIDVYFSQKCDDCVNIFYNLNSGLYINNIKNILNLEFEDNDVKYLSKFVKDIECFFNNNDINKFINS